MEFTRSRGIWCDGIVELSIERPTRKSFQLTAAAYAPNQLAPVELELHFQRRRDTRPSRMILRFGYLDGSGAIQWQRKPLKASAMLAYRPHSDRDWAVAVEFIYL